MYPSVKKESQMPSHCGNCNALLDHPFLPRCPRCGAIFRGYKAKKVFAALILVIFFSLLGATGLGWIRNLINGTIADVFAVIGAILCIAPAIFLAKVME
jgi:hypothetical protein